MTRYILLSFLERIPVFLILLAGLLVAAARWKRHPTVSLITLIGIVLYSIKLVAFTALNFWVSPLREAMGWSYETTNNVFTILHVLSDIGFALFVMILVIAAFWGRKPEVAAAS